MCEHLVKCCWARFGITQSSVVFVPVIHRWQWNEPRLEWKSIRLRLDVWEELPALWTRALGPWASRQTAPFMQNYCQEKKQKNRPTRMDVGGHCRNGGPLQLVTHFCEKCRFMLLNRLVNLCRQLWGCWNWLSKALSLTLFWFMCLWMSAHTHHTATEGSLMACSSQARVT